VLKEAIRSSRFIGRGRISQYDALPAQVNYFLKIFVEVIDSFTRTLWYQVHIFTFGSFLAKESLYTK